MSRANWIRLILLSLLWGGSFLFVGIAVRELPPFTIVFARVALAAACLLPLLPLYGLRLPTGIREWRPFAVMAILNNVIPFMLIVVGQREISVGLASVLNATTPLFTLLVAYLFANDGPMPAHRVLGVLLGLCGVIVLVGPDAFAGAMSSVFGMCCVLGAALSYGFSGLWGRRLRTHAPLVSATSQLLMSSLLLLPAAVLIDMPWRLAAPSLSALLAVVGLAVLATAAAYLLFFRILAEAGPLNVMLVTLLIPVSGIVLGHVVLGEPIVPGQLVGSAVIAASLLLIDGRLLPHRLRPQS